MSSTQQLLLGEGAGGSGPANYIEDVFSTYLYNGDTGGYIFASSGVSIVSGGMMWVKSRGSATNNYIFSPSLTNANYYLNTNTTAAQSNSGVTNNNFEAVDNGGGMRFGGAYSGISSSATGPFTSWTFRKQPKFFDVVTYTGTGSLRTVSHSLGSVPGCIIIKNLSDTDGWLVYHRSIGATKTLGLNTTGAAVTDGATYFNDTEPTSTVFTVKEGGKANASGNNYVAYLFAHNAGGFGLTGTDNVISCGSFTSDGSGNATVNLGWEPQWVLWKESNNINDWKVMDIMRGFSYSQTRYLRPNSSGAELSWSTAGYIPTVTATGFQTNGQASAGDTFIYIAIRRGPMGVPTSGTSVFAPFYASYSEGAAITTNFPIDLSMWKGDVTYNWSWQDRLRGTPTSTGSGGPALASNSTAAETTSYTGVGITKLDSNTGGSVSYQADSGRSNAAAYFMLRRAPGFFDEVCYTGTGSAVQTYSHNLGVAPELMIVKCRNDAGRNWTVYSSALGNGFRITLQQSLQAFSTTVWNSTSPTATQFTVTSDPMVGANTFTYVNYLFATCAGVSKVGSYTGNGSTQQIDCGFTGGARFVMIKQTSGSGGDWYVYSSALGIVAGSDRTVLFNSSNASSAFGDTLDALSSGFELGPNSSSFGTNENGGTYIFLAIA